MISLASTILDSVNSTKDLRVYVLQLTSEIIRSYPNSSKLCSVSECSESPEFVLFFVCAQLCHYVRAYPLRFDSRASLTVRYGISINFGILRAYLCPRVWDYRHPGP